MGYDVKENHVVFMSLTNLSFLLMIIIIDKIFLYCTFKSIW